MTTTDDPTELGPAYVILRVTQLRAGGARILARARGGRMINLYVPPALNNGIDAEHLVELALRHQPPYPPRT